MHIFPFPYLAHIGCLDFSEKKPGSYEGSGVSVSTHPAAWARIARIGSGGFILKKESGSDIDLVNALGLTKQEKANVIAWAKGEGLIEDRHVWVASYFDVETEKRCSFECQSRENAKAELEDLPQRRISGPKTVISATDKLLSAESHAPGDTASSSLTFDLALIQYVQAKLDADGIWWDERLDVDEYSAPRGVIFSSKLNSFNRFEVNFDDMGEDDCIFDEDFDLEDKMTI
jgi:hypothetical protein